MPGILFDTGKSTDAKTLETHSHCTVAMWPQDSKERSKRHVQSELKKKKKKKESNRSAKLPSGADSQAQVLVPRPIYVAPSPLVDPAVRKSLASDLVRWLSCTGFLITHDTYTFIFSRAQFSFFLFNTWHTMIRVQGGTAENLFKRNYLF